MAHLRHPAPQVQPLPDSAAAARPTGPALPAADDALAMRPQGLLLAGCALLLIVPLLTLTVIALSHGVDRVELLQTVRRYLEWLVPGQSQAIVAELAGFLAHRDVLGWVLL